MEDAQIAWLLIGWMLAFWAGKDLQARIALWRASRRPQPVLVDRDPKAS